MTDLSGGSAGLPPAPPPVPDGLALPRDFDATYGRGLGHTLSLGGGGLFFVAWQVTYLFEMAQRGIDLGHGERVVGTSAGSVVASVLGAGNISRLHKEIGVLAKWPRLVAALAPAADLSPSQNRALEVFALAADAEPDTIRAIGHAALAAQTPDANVIPRNLTAILASRGWPAPELHITCTDAYTGERCVVTFAAGVRTARAVAASSAVPGLFAPQPILDRRCMDGGVSGTGLHLDLLAGSRRAVVLGLTDGAGVEEGMMTAHPGSVVEELDALRASGTDVFFRMPESMDVLRLMDPTAVPEAMAMARRQAATDAEELRAFWS